MEGIEISSLTPTPPQQENAELRQGEAPPVEFAPVLLAQLQDELARSRMREAFWISVVLHLVIAIALALSPKWMPKPHSVELVSTEQMLKDRELTFLDLPKDQQTPPAKSPNAKFLSDKNRIATSRNPTIDRKTLDELRDPRRAGMPGVSAPPTPQVTPTPQGSQAQQEGSQQQGQQMAASNSNNSIWQQPPPPKQQASNQNPFAGAMSAGSAIAQAARSTARAGVSGAGGEFGMGPGGSQGKVRSDIDVLSDTMGVDFGPYLSRVLQSVRLNWYNLIPEVARAPLMKKGKVAIEFAILPDGKVAGMRLIGPSGDVSLDRAAWGGITGSNPFSPLPSEFKGPYLALRFHFLYNPDRSDMQ